MSLRAPWVVCITLLAVLIAGQAQGELKCCRRADTAVRYTDAPSDITRPGDCDVIRALPENDTLAVTIRCPSGRWEEQLGFLTSKELTTRNYGTSWKKEGPIEPVPSPLFWLHNDFLQAPSDKNVLYRYVQELGLYLRSQDGGHTWLLPKYTIEGLPWAEFSEQHGGTKFHTPDFHLASIDPRNPLKLYAGITLSPWASLIYVEGELDFVELNGLYVSNDGGDSWTKFSNLPLNTSPLGISPSHPAVIYARAPEGVVKSEDGGKSWAPVGQNAELASPVLPEQRPYAEKAEFEITQFAVDPQDENIVFIVSNKGVYRSMDAGKTWCLLNLGFDEFGGIHSIAINPANPAEIFVGTGPGVFYSKDRGCHFQKIFSRQ